METLEHLWYLQASYKEAGKGFFTSHVVIEQGGMVLNQNRVYLDKKKILHCENGEAWVQVAWRSRGCLSPGKV